MTDEKVLRRVIPLRPGDDVDVLRWLTRESFELDATANQQVVVKFDDRVLDSKDVPVRRRPRRRKGPELTDQLDHPIDHYEWREFTATVAWAGPTAPTPQVCPYCQHPPHQAGECSELAVATWLPQGSEPGPCLCVGV